MVWNSSLFLSLRGTEIVDAKVVLVEFELFRFIGTEISTKSSSVSLLIFEYRFLQSSKVPKNKLCQKNIPCLQNAIK